MDKLRSETRWVPGVYPEKGKAARELAEQFIQQWLKKPIEVPEKLEEARIYPSICLSREYGSGAMEVADSLSQKIGLKVIDRQVLEYISEKAQLSPRVISWYDERYVGRRAEFFFNVISKKMFAKTDYVKYLFYAVTSFANSGSSIFVGRGVHFLLPRDRILAVRLVASQEWRAIRIADMLSIGPKEAAARIEEVDHEQNEFFKNVYGVTQLTYYDFDLILNCEQFTDLAMIVDLLAQAFKIKFGSEVI